MSDRINALTVVLDREYRDDDVQAIVEAIKMIRGVVSVGMNVANMTDHIALARAKMELAEKLRDIISDSYK